MALKYNQSFTNTAIIGNKEIKYLPWTTKNEKTYLISVESKEEIDDDILYDMLIKPCLEDPNISLSKNEKKMLMIEIRKSSLGSTFPMQYICNSCKRVNDIEVSFDDVVKYKPDTWGIVESHNLIFEFSEVPSENIRKRLKETNSNTEYAYVELLIHIKSITQDGIKEDSFTFDELNEFIENIPVYIFDEVFKEFNSMKSNLEFELKSNCLVCNHENDIDFEYLPNFLWL